MNPVAKALWYIESHFGQDLVLDDVARVAGVSRYHLARAFGVSTGRSILRHVRGRRLSEAARQLCGGAPDILDVALQAGYGSHEAFTRAFREQFGLTPEMVRAQGHLHNIQLVEPLKMDETPVNLQAPRYVDGKPMLIAGLGGRVNCEGSNGIPAQWQRFGPSIGHIPGQIGGNTAFGVCSNGDDEGNLDYVCGVEVSDFNGIPADWSRLRLAAQRYAVFSHPGHVSDIRGIWNAILNHWLPQSGHESADAPDFERYGESFDARTGQGGFEIWVPLKR
ncbi:MAG TPA: AraC family transcriptional regulator [Nevskia sp.]|nr:AraC family transcriptional regulator [Nevskia sp.]